MSDLTLRDMLQLCPFQSVVGARGADLLGETPAVIVAAPTPGQIDHDEAELDQVRDLMRQGGTVLVLAARFEDREMLLDLLGISDRVRVGGRA